MRTEIQNGTTVHSFDIFDFENGKDSLLIWLKSKVTASTEIRIQRTMEVENPDAWICAKCEAELFKPAIRALRKEFPGCSITDIDEAEIGNFHLLIEKSPQ